MQRYLREPNACWNDPKSQLRLSCNAGDGGFCICSHDHVCSQVAIVVRSWDVRIMEESHWLLPGSRRMDLVCPAAGPGRAFLAVDMTRCFGAARALLTSAERAKGGEHRLLRGLS